MTSTSVTTNSVTTTVEIRADNNGSPASTALVSTAVSDSVLTTGGVKTATFTTAQKLDPNTTYHVVLNFTNVASSSKVINIRIRNPGQDAESISGWSVGGRTQQKTTLSSAWNNLSGDADKRLSIGIYGYYAPSIQIRPNADTGIKGDGITSVTGGDLWFVLRGFRKTGNGDVTLTARSDTHSCSQSYRCSIRQSFYHIKNTITLSLGPSGITQARSGVWTLTATNGEQTATHVVTIIPNPPSLLASNLQQTTGKGNATLITSNTPGSQAITGYAQPFSTGDNYYALEKVQYEVAEAASALAQGDTGSFTVSVVEEGSDGGPSTTTLVSKVEPHSAVESAGVKTTTFATPLNLQPNKTYYVVFKYLHSQGAAEKVKLAYVTVGTDDAGGVSGWSIEDTYQYFTTADQWRANSRAFNIALTGSRVPTIDLKASSDTGVFDDDDLTSDTTPTLVLKGFYGDITITATHATASNVTASRTGDGEVDLAELADGEWTLTATDGTRTATLTITVNRDLPIFMVGNTEQTPQSLGPELGKGNFSSKVALTVTTGTTPYTVENVRFRISSAAADNDGAFTVTIESDSSSLPDGTPLATAIVPHDEIETTGVKTATFARPLDLAASTTYHIVFSYVPAGTQSIQVGAVNSDDEDDNSLAGWSLGNGNTYYDGSWTTGTISQEVSLYGYSTLAHSVKLHADSDTGSSAADNITNDTTPKVTVAGFANSQTVTITATKGNLTKTATRTGNGDATFASGQALSSDGVWSLVATDGTLTSRSLRITIDTTPPPAIAESVVAFNPSGPLGSDLYINKADDDAAPENLLVTTANPAGASYKQLATIASCDQNELEPGWFVEDAVQTNDIAGGDDDDYRICVRLMDTAGNAVYRSSATFTRDISVPVISSASFPSGTINDATPNISFTSSEAGTTRAHAACNIGELAVASGTNTFTIPQLTSKAYTNCSLIVEDAAGNPSAEQTFSFTVDAGTIALKDGYDDGIDTSDNRISAVSPNFVVSGFGGTVTLSAQKTGGGSPTTNTRTGDGDIFLDLEEGEWTISVSDDQSPSKSTSIVITIDEELPALILKNFDQTEHSDDRISMTLTPGGATRQKAQSFTTGDVPYFVKQVQFEVWGTDVTTNSVTTTVEIRADNNGSPASTALVSTAVSDSVLTTRGIKTATFTTAQKLDPNTTYHVVLNFAASGSSSKSLALRIHNPGQDAESISGWSVGSRVQKKRSTLSSWSNETGDADKRLSIGLYGYQAPFINISENEDTGIKGDKKTKPQAGSTDFYLLGFHQKHGEATITATKQGATTKTGSNLGSTGRGVVGFVVINFSTTDATEHGDWEIVATNGTQSFTDTFTIDPNTPTTLVANIQKSVSTTNQATLNATNGKAAAQFTTPTGTTVYTLNEVQYWVKTAAADSNGSFTISVQGENSSLPDGTKIDTVTVNHDDIETAGKKVAVFGSGVDLAAGTNYWLVFEYTPAGSESVVLHTSSATSEDGDGISGWSLGDKLCNLRNSVGWVWDRHPAVSGTLWSGDIAV